MKPQTKSATFTQIFVIFLGFIWLLAVYKVFFLKQNAPLLSTSDLIKEQHLLSNSKLMADSASRLIHHKMESKLIDYVDHSAVNLLADIPPSKEQRRIPDVSEWSIMYEKSGKHIFATTNNPTMTVDEAHYSKQQQVDPPKLVVRSVDSVKQPYELIWPPVLSDSAIPVEDGEDTMPLLGIKVPRFWEAPPGADLNAMSSKVGDQETIFLMIASYRDFQCRETIESAFTRADHPERLFVGAVDQVVDGDIGCLDLEVPCSVNPEQNVCKYWNQIAVFKVDAKAATGPVTARHIGDRLYRGQHYFMQMDAHCTFVRHWDSSIISQLKETGNDMAVLSTYLSDVQGAIDGNGDSNIPTRPIMCESDYEGEDGVRYLRHGSQPEDYPVIKDMPQMQPYWAAGFSFSRGHFVVRVPYDAYQPMVFQGEEIAIGIRGFTHGYDFYAPRKSVVFHEYASASPRRNKVKMYWSDNASLHRGEGVKSLKRAMSIIHMAKNFASDLWDHSEMERYGLGSARSVELFYKLFLIDIAKQKVVKICPFVARGTMHKKFQPFLREDGKGIDYSKLSEFDTENAIFESFASDRPGVEKKLRAAINAKEASDIQFHLDNAIRVRLNKSKPELIDQAREMLKHLE